MNARPRSPLGADSRRDRRTNIVWKRIMGVCDARPGAVGMATTPKANVVNLNRIRRPTTSGELASAGRHYSPTFCSILFARPEDRIGNDAAPPPPAFFADLNCDQIVEAITLGRDEYNLKPFFYALLPRLGTIEYRHAVMQDLERPGLCERVSSFAEQMRSVRSHLVQTEKMYYKEQKEAWFLDGVEIYCEIIRAFAAALTDSDLRSRGFLAFREYLAGYSKSEHFRSMRAQVKELKADLGKIEYCVLVKGNGFTVRKYEGEGDYSAEVELTFEKFKQGAVKDYRVKYSASADMNHVEAKILEFVARLHPELFQALTEFCARTHNFIDRTVAAFDREVQFYLAYLEYIEPLRRSGLAFCYPVVSDTNQEVCSHEAFDIALAHKLVKEDLPIVCNDFELQGRERILVVSGPNQGGKTTFARAFGQLHYLAKLGCPVPGSEAKLLLFDKLLTHFEKEEKVENLRGKLEDDLLRIRDILGRTTPLSIVIMNEIFTSTTIQDETFLSEKVMERLIRLRALCVWVTFVDELASFAPQVVSMVSTVAAENPALRTFKIVRRPADGLAYAMAIAQRYGLTYDMIKQRITS
jgi:DNA mismatch repair protein MutS